MVYKSNSSDETINIGEKFGRGIAGNCAILLYGEMGAGKTHFVKGLARGLNISAHVTSPTFAIVNEYENKLFHFDLFRITSFDDLYAIGFFDYIDRGIIVCEWSENIPGFESEFENYYKISLIKKGENEREIHVNSGA
ncbi:MAG: tRNA (adenosine(37)-N6)-threonylcarbamoyltransferase complex ATPase subunit type 1 TsaE [Oscillospiraceae bacterium]|jgi:tRNA threonylcarbamoyladenosine biosynthesis protein TsaE|nr:tRNA (adenosine(37)-N6)-threonylcarbamoyltransferase complex ATPase subunit type 1 TsaE [Oscillospiraceae bacterium]